MNEMNPPDPAADASLRARRPRLAGLIIGAVAFLGVVALILHLGDIGAFAGAIRATDPSWLLLAVVAQGLAFLAQSLVWALVLARRKCAVGKADLFFLSIGKLFADQTVPSAGVSGAVFIVHALTRRGVGAADAFAVFIFGAVSFILTFVLFAAAALAFLALRGDSIGGLSPDLSDIHYVAIAVALFAFSIGAVAIAAQSRNKDSGALARIRRSAIEAAAVIRKERGLFIACIGLQTIQRLLDGATLWIAFEALGGGAPFWASVIAVSLASLAATIAPTPMGLGSFEAGLIAALAALGHDVEAAFAAGLIYRGMSLGLPLALGFLVVQRELLRK